MLIEGQRAIVYKIDQRTGMRILDGWVKLIKKYNCPDLWEVEDEKGSRNKRFVYESDQECHLKLVED